MAQILDPLTSLPKLLVTRDAFGLLTGSEWGDAAITAVCLFITGYLVHDVVERLIANRKKTNKVSFLSLARVVRFRDWTTRKIAWRRSPEHNGSRYEERNRIMRAIVTTLGILLLLVDFALVVIGLPLQRISFLPLGQVPVAVIRIPEKADLFEYKNNPCLTDDLVENKFFTKPTVRISCAPDGTFFRTSILPGFDAMVGIAQTKVGGRPTMQVTVIQPNVSRNIFMTESIRWEKAEWYLSIRVEGDLYDRYEALMTYWGDSFGFSLVKSFADLPNIWNVTLNPELKLKVQTGFIPEIARAAVRTGIRIELADGNVTAVDGAPFEGQIEKGRHGGTIVTTLGSIILVGSLLLIWLIVRFAGFHRQEWDGWWLIQTFRRFSGDDILAGPNEIWEVDERWEEDGTLRLEYVPLKGGIKTRQRKVMLAGRGSDIESI